MKDLLKNTAMISGTEVALIAVSVIRNKYLAVNIGTEGFGIYGLLNSFFSIVGVIGGTWLVAGATKYVAEFRSKGDTQGLQSVVSFSSIVTLSLTGGLAVLAVVFESFAREHLLPSSVLPVYFVLFAFSIVGSTQCSILSALLQGLMAIKRIVFLRVTVSVLDLIFVILLVHFWGLLGFFIGIFLSSVYGLWLYWHEVHKASGTRWRLPGLKEDISKKLLAFGGVNFFLSVTSSVSQYLQRYIVDAFLAISAVGQFQAATSLMNHLGILNRGTIFSFMPRMCEELSMEARNKSFDDFLRLNLITGVPLSVVAILFGKVLIAVFYSKQFLPLADSFYLFVLARLAVSLELGLQSVVLGNAFLKIHTVASLLNTVLWVTVPYLLIARFGLSGMAVGLIVASLAASTTEWIYLTRKISLRVDPETIRLGAVGTVLLGGSILLRESGIPIRLLFSGLAVFATFVLMRRHERTEMIFLLKKRLVRN